MNIYTGDVFINNYYENSYTLVIDRLLDPFDRVRTIEFNDRKIAFLATRRKGDTRLKRNGKNIDFMKLRDYIALEGYRLGKVDIYGRGWPAGVSLEESRGKNRISRKAEILSKYRFNLCFENTNYPYYCTEKILESIKFGCLPIYYGKGNNIYMKIFL